MTSNLNLKLVVSILFGLTSIVVLSSTPISAKSISEVKDGQKCSKVGQLSSDNDGNELVCKRIRGKRVWQLASEEKSVIAATNLKVQRAWGSTAGSAKFTFSWDSFENWGTQTATLIYWNAAFPSYQYRYPATDVKSVVIDFLSIQPVCFTILSESKRFGINVLSNAACEDVATVFTTTTTSTTTTVAPRRPPSGNYWEKQQLNSSNILMYGNPYRLYLCTNGSANSVLTLWVNVLNTWVKRAESYGTTSDSSCSGDYPTTQSFYWFIDWSGTPTSNTRATLNLKVTGLSQDYFYNRTIWPSQGAANQEASELARKIACAFGQITGCK